MWRPGFTAGGLALVGLLAASGDLPGPAHAQSITAPAGTDTTRAYPGPRSATRPAGSSGPTLPAGSRGITPPAGGARPTVPAGNAVPGTGADPRPAPRVRSAFQAVERNAFGTPLEMPTPAVTPRRQPPAPTPAAPPQAQPRPAYSAGTRPGTGEAAAPQQEATVDPGNEYGGGPTGAPNELMPPGGPGAAGRTPQDGFDPFGWRSLDRAEASRPGATSPIGGSLEENDPAANRRWVDPVYAPDDYGPEGQSSEGARPDPGIYDPDAPAPWDRGG